MSFFEALGFSKENSSINSDDSIKQNQINPPQIKQTQIKQTQIKQTQIKQTQIKQTQIKQDKFEETHEITFISLMGTKFVLEYKYLKKIPKITKACS
jgi:hypothetical protein